MAETPDSPSRDLDYDQALRLIPQLIESGKLTLAKAWARKVISARPMDPRGWNQHAMVSARLGDVTGALHYMRLVALIEPGSAELLVNHGNTNRMRGKHEVALKLFRRAQIARPNDFGIDVAAALQLLTVGNYEEGLAVYERRWSRWKALEELGNHGVAAWDGDPSSASSVVCVIEQGAGDAVQFVRYAADLSRAGIEVIVYCTPPLARLLGAARGVKHAVTRIKPNMADAAEMIMSLPFRFGTRAESLPAPGRYIDPPEHPFRLPVSPGRPRVGVCWAGNPNHQRDQQRSCPFSAMAMLFDVEGIDFYTLQVGQGAADAEQDARVVSLSDHIDDFADTAGLIDQLDLVITVDSAVAHIAGALDRPCWVLLHWVADWRWGQNGATTGWYPNTRLERRELVEEWDDFMPRIVDRLTAWRDELLADHKS